MTYHAADPITISRILDLVRPELGKVTSRKDLKRRLARLGFGFRDTQSGRMLTTMPHGVEIAPMPTQLTRF